VVWVLCSLFWGVGEKKKPPATFREIRQLKQPLQKKKIAGATRHYTDRPDVVGLGLKIAHFIRYRSLRLAIFCPKPLFFLAQMT
jgi:hypothetical protein